MQVKDRESKHRWIKPTSNRKLQLLGLYNMSSQLLQPANGHKKRILAIKGQKMSAEGQSKSRSILTAEPMLRPRRRSETRHRQKKKKVGDEDGEMTEKKWWNKGWTNRKRNVETKSWVDKKRERIPAGDRERRGGGGKETYGSHYKPMMSCMYVR